MASETIEKTSYITILILSVVAAMFNFMVVWVIAVTPRIRRRKANKLLLNFLVADFCAALSIFIYCVSRLIATSKDVTMEIIFIIGVLMIISMDSLISLTLDRLVSVKCPFFYDSKIKTKHIYWIIASTWIFALIYMVILIVIEDTLEATLVSDIIHISLVVLIVTGTIVMAITNAFAFIIAHKQLKAIAKNIVTTNSVRKTLNEKNRSKECRLVRLSVGMVLVFVLCWTPSVYCWSYVVHNNAFPPQTVLIAAWHLVVIRYILDPITYVGLSRDLKTEIQRLLRIKNNNERPHYSDSYGTQEHIEEQSKKRSSTALSQISGSSAATTLDAK